MRNAYLNTLYELARKDKNVLSLVADNGVIVYDDFRRDFPRQYFNFGISESNMVAAAAGMAACGKIPFVYTISAFLVYRAFEFIRNDVCLHNANVKIIGIGSGVTYSTLGPSHHTTEDIGLLRVLPNLTVFSPGCPEDVKNIVTASYRIDGPVYIRLGENKLEKIYRDDTEFEVGKAMTIREGNDIAFFATGSIIADVLKAADRLEAKGIRAKVVNVHTLKPIDTEMIIRTVKNFNIIITIEEHSIIGGLGSIVSEVMAEYPSSARLYRVGLKDCFANGYGTPEEVRKANGLDADSIIDTVMSIF